MKNLGSFIKENIQLKRITFNNLHKPIRVVYTITFGLW